jgi:hypothetical protein
VPESDTDKLLALARKTPSNLRYFFERLDDPGWIDVLEREGFFATPPDVERTQDDKGTWLRFPDWPASRYLARVANAAPERVAHALLRLPDTDNIRVHEDIVEAAQQMPLEWADRLAVRELRWFEAASGPMLNYPLQLVDLGLHLLQGRPASAKAIFDAVLTLQMADASSSSRRRASSRLSDWDYGQALQKIWPALLEHEGCSALLLMARKLAGAVELSMREDGHDVSYIWRPAIEAHVQNLGGSAFDELVDATRDMAVAAAADQPEQVLRWLEKFDSPIFARLRLHVLRVVGDRLPQQTMRALLQRASLEDPDLWHEYAELLRARFGQLDSDQQVRLLRMIREGTAEEAEDHSDGRDGRRAYRRFERLAVIADQLDGDARTDYEALHARFGPPDHPEFLAHTSFWSGPASPLSADEIRQRTPVELVQFLAEWQPQEISGPHSSPEGLNRVLTEVVAEEPAAYAAEALRFIDCDPTYVRGLLDGLAQAAKAGRQFEWEPPLQLAKWVIEQPHIERPARPDMERDIGWSWSRKAVAALLSRGLEAGRAALPPESRADVWKLLSVLAEDSDPAPGHERDEGGMDPATRSLNVTRGEAMHAVVRFVMWVERLEEEAFEGLASVPEAKALLERHLDPEHDPSPAVRAVYGMWLAQLVRLDEVWVSERAQEIFPADPGQLHLFAAAWNAYVVFTRPWLAVLSAIKQAYAQAIERLVDRPAGSTFTDRPDEKLAEHLVWYAVMSAIAIEEPELWQDFWNRASDHLRQHAVEHLGRMFHRATDVPAEVQDRVEQLWGWIVANVDRKARQMILAPFGWLLAAKALDDEWLLKQALALLEDGIHLEADFEVWEALVRTVDEHPAASAGVLRMMIQTDINGWAVRGSEDAVRAILQRALQSDDAEAHRRARDAVNLLGARGMHGFRDLAEREPK